MLLCWCKFYPNLDANERRGGEEKLGELGGASDATHPTPLCLWLHRNSLLEAAIPHLVPVQQKEDTTVIVPSERVLRVNGDET